MDDLRGTSLVGRTLAHYRISAVIGAGGMGEVYRAHDTKLGREVALKVLPAEFAADAERMARFEREAKLLASLNHPNIASIYGFEDSSGAGSRTFGTARALVMELVEGQTLAEKISGVGATLVVAPAQETRAGARPAPTREQAIPIDEALPIAKQICEGLEYAHERGIVHRDLKPANIKITPDGVVKILDFGLAKALEGDIGAAGDPSTSPTLSHLATQAGIILGTAAYMSPEQAKGKAVDRRADIWGFGCVLYEILAGRPAFGGETVSDVLAAVIRAEPDWSLLPVTTPAIRTLLARCLKKDPKQRLQAIGDARIAIEEVLNGTVEPAAPVAAQPNLPLRPAWLRTLPWAIAVLAVLAAGIAAVYFRPAKPPGAVMRFTLAPPAGGVIGRPVGASAVLSPDGTQMVYVLQSGENSQLYVRLLASDEATALPGTQGAMMPFFSPEGHWVAFFAQGKLKKVAVTGGLPVTLCDAADARGGDWGPNDTILFTPTADSPLERVSANGGTPSPVTRLTSKPEPDSRSHRWPWFLPGGKQALFNVVYHAGNPLDHSDIGVVSLATGQYKILIRGGSYPRYVPTGSIVYVVGTDLLAVPFDTNKLELTGTPTTVVKGVETQLYSGGAEYAFSGNGTLLYIPKNDQPPAMSKLVWVDRKGMAQPITTKVRSYAFPRVLPDGRRIVVQIQGEQPGIWLYDATRDNLGPLTVGGARGPVLSPDGEDVIYNSIRNGSEGLWMRRVDGSGGEENFTATTLLQMPSSVSPDGKWVAYTVGTATSSVLMMLSLEGNHPTQSLLPGPGNRAAAAFSPDGRWIAYVSDESGRNEVYVAAASGQGEKWQISSGGGTEPLWARSGRELFYRSGDKMMAVAVKPGTSLFIGRPTELFEGDYARSQSSPLASPPDYDVSPDGRRFLMIQPTGPATANASPTGLHVVLNWFLELAKTGAASQP